jgi:hypothetical protein
VRGNLDHKIHHDFMAFITENWQGASTMGEIDYLTLIMCAVYFHYKSNPQFSTPGFSGSHGHVAFHFLRSGRTEQIILLNVTSVDDMIRNLILKLF